MTKFTDLTETIVALATPPGRGGVGIVRLSGPQARTIGQRLFRPARPELTRPRRLGYGWAVEPRTGRVLDRALAVFLPGPLTLTGQDIFELQAHGGPGLLDLLLGLAVDEGARPALPGEFSYRAYLAGKLDLAQAEAILELTSAQGRAGLLAAAEQMEGRLSQAVAALAREAKTILAHLHAAADFPDEATPELGRREITGLLDSTLLPGLDRLLAACRQGRELNQARRVVLFGPTNVGKSSLFNALLGRRRALVSAQPGTTRDYLEAALEINGATVTLVDTAGQEPLAALAEPLDAAGMALGRDQAQEADLILLVTAVDSTLPLLEIFRLDEEIRARSLLVVNKADLAGGLASPWPELPSVAVSALTGQGLGELRRLIAQRLDLVEPGPAQALLTTLRQEAALNHARQAWIQAKTGLDQGAGEEAVALDLEEGLNRLAQITGEAVSAALLEEIFSRFCLGK